jgi:hypothetical protein
MNDLAQKLQLNVWFAPKQLGKRMDADLVRPHRRNRLRGVHVVPGFGQAEEIAREEKRGDATPAVRQVAVGLDDALRQ